MMNSKDIKSKVIHILCKNKGVSTIEKLPDVHRHEVITAIKKLLPDIPTKEYTEIIGGLRKKYKSELRIIQENIPYEDIINDILKNFNTEDKVPVEIPNEALKTYIKKHAKNLDNPQINKVITRLRKHYGDHIKSPYLLHLFNYVKFMEFFLKNQGHMIDAPLVVDREVIKKEIKKFDKKLTTDAVSATIRNIEKKYKDKITITESTLLYQTLLENIYKHLGKNIERDKPITVSRDIVHKVASSQYPDADSRRIKDIIHSLRQSYPIIIPSEEIESFESKLVEIIYKDKDKNPEEHGPLLVSASYIKTMIIKELPEAEESRIRTLIYLLRKNHSHLLTVPLKKRLSHLDIVRKIYRHVGKNMESDSLLEISRATAIKIISILYPDLTPEQIRGKILSLQNKYDHLILISEPSTTYDCAGIVDELCSHSTGKSMPLAFDKKDVVTIIQKHFPLYGSAAIGNIYRYLLQHYADKIDVPYKTFPYVDFIAKLSIRHSKHVDENNLLILKRELTEKEIKSEISDIDANGLKKVVDNLRANYPERILIPVKANAKTLLKYTKNSNVTEASFSGKSYRIIGMSDVVPYIEKPIRMDRERIFFYPGPQTTKQGVALLDDSALMHLDPSNGFVMPLTLLKSQTFGAWKNMPKYLYGISLLFNGTHRLSRPERLSKEDYTTQLEYAAKELKRLGYIATYPSQLQSLFRIFLLTDIALPISTQHINTIKRHLHILKDVTAYRDHMFLEIKIKLGAIEGETITVGRNSFRDTIINTIDPAGLLNNSSNLHGIQHKLTYDKQSIVINDEPKETGGPKKISAETMRNKKSLIFVKKKAKLPIFNTTNNILSAVKESQIPLLWIEFKELLSSRNIVTNKQRDLNHEMLIVNDGYKKLNLQSIVDIATIKKSDIKLYTSRTAYLTIHAKVFLAWLSVSKNLCLLSTNFWSTVHHRQENIGPKIAQIMQKKQLEQIKHILKEDKKGEKSYINYLLSCSNLSVLALATEDLFTDFKAYGLKNLESIPGLSTNSTKGVRWRTFHEMLYALGGHNLLPPLPEKNDPEFYTAKYLREFKSTKSIQRFHDIVVSMYNNSDVGENYVRDMARIFRHMINFPIEDTDRFTDEDFNSYTDPNPQNINGFHSFLLALKSNHTASRLQAKLLMTAQAALLEDGLKFKESHLIQKYATPKGKTKQALDEEILIKMKEICLTSPPSSTYYPIKKIDSKKSWWEHGNVEPFLPIAIFIAASFPHRSAHTTNHDLDSFLQYDSLGNFSGIGIFTDKNKDRKKPFFIPKNLVYQVFGSFYLNSENQEKINHEKAKADVELLENLVQYAKNDYLNGAEIQLAFVNNNERNADGTFKPLFYHPKNNGTPLGKVVFDDYFYRVLIQALHELDLDINNFVKLGASHKIPHTKHKIIGKDGEVYYLSELPNKDDDIYEDFIWHTINKKSTKSQLVSPQGFSPHALRMSNITRLIDLDVDPVVIMMISGLESINTILAHYIDKKIYKNYEFTRKAAREMGYTGDLSSKLVPDVIHKFLLSQDNSTEELAESLLDEGFVPATIIDWDGGYRYNEDPKRFLVQYDKKFWRINPLGICTRPDCILNGNCGSCPYYLTGHSFIKGLNVKLMESTTSLAIYGNEFFHLRTNGELSDTEAKFAEDSQRERYLAYMGWESIIEDLSRTASKHMSGDSLIEDRAAKNASSTEESPVSKNVKTEQTMEIEYFTGMLTFYLEAKDSGSKTLCRDYGLITSKLANKINRLYNKHGLRDFIMETAPLSTEEQIDWFTKLTDITSSDEIFKKILKSKSREKDIFKVLDESFERAEITGLKSLLIGK